MSYKGNDLELRTPYAPGAGEDGEGQTSWSLLPELGRDGPIPVDVNGAGLLQRRL